MQRLKAGLSHSLWCLTLVLADTTCPLRSLSHTQCNRGSAVCFQSAGTQFLFIRIPSHRTFLSVYFFLCPHSLANYRAAGQKWGKWVCRGVRHIVLAQLSRAPNWLYYGGSGAAIKSKQMLMDEADIITIIASVFCFNLCLLLSVSLWLNLSADFESARSSLGNYF